jgi:integrase
MGMGLQMVEKDWLMPLAVFPGVRAPMLAPEAWSMTFREANSRVVVAAKSQGSIEPRRITPHMLRHTFATEWLSAELDRIAEHDRDFANAAAQGDHAALRRRHMNPLVRMMRLLGHRRLETTLLYIDYLMREEQTSFMPADSWIESFMGRTS